MIITLFYTFLVLAALAVVVWGVVSWRRRAGGDYKSVARHERAKRMVAERAIREIASGSSGNPVLTAQLALDDIGNLDMKELS